MRYKTRNNSSPQGKPRVYFCCHPKDHERYFQSISDEILAKQNCAIWYADADAVRDEDFLADLKQMQLFVMPVTKNLLCTENAALDLEFRLAIEQHIPVLPLLQDSTLVEQFNQTCGDLHFLNRRADDITAISYDEKLEKYLSSVLIGDDLAQKIRAAFDAYVFLSYRKKDRKHAQELMCLIHSHKAFRDIAIWYDEFLTPGDNFNDSIAKALEKSSLFLMVVTPNLVCESNYVQTHEYPMARQAGKPVLPAELVPTDRDRLEAAYADIPAPTDAHNESALSKALLDALEKMTVKENDGSPEHNFLIGLAFLGGVDVEVNTTLAVEAITKAAEDGLPEAVDKLYKMYLYGNGVARDPKKATEVKLRYAKRCKKQFAKTGDLAYARSYIDSITAVCRWQVENKMIHRPRARLFLCYAYYFKKITPHLSEEESAWLEYAFTDVVYRIRYAQGHFGAAERLCKNMVEMLQKAGAKDRPVETAVELFRATRRLARLRQRFGDYDTAETLHKKNVKLALDLSAMLKQKEDYAGWVAVAYHDLEELYYTKGDIEQGEAYAAKVLESLLNAHDGNGPMMQGSLHNLGTSYSEMGDIKCDRGDLAGALDCYEESAKAFRQLKETQYTTEAVYHLAEACSAMGDIHRALGNAEDAAKCYREALALFTEAANEQPEAHRIEVTRLKLALLDEDTQTLQQLKPTFLALHRANPENQLFTDALDLIDSHTAG